MSEFNAGTSGGMRMMKGPTQDELLSIEEEIRASFPVLKEAVYDLSRRFTSKNTGGMYQTDPISVVLPKSDEALTVFLGYAAKESLPNHVIYVQNDDTELFHPLIVISPRKNTIFDGENTEKKTHEQMIEARHLIDAMTEAYEAEAENIANQDLSDHVRSSIDMQVSAIQLSIAALSAKMGALEVARSQGEMPERKKIRIKLTSGWEYDGEKSLDKVYEGMDLSAAVHQAAKDFKQLNRRSDVQASIKVSFVLEQDVEIEIPQQVVAPIFQSLAVYRGQDRALEAQKEELKTLFKD